MTQEEFVLCFEINNDPKKSIVLYRTPTLEQMDGLVKSFNGPEDVKKINFKKIYVFIQELIYRKKISKDNIKDYVKLYRLKKVYTIEKRECNEEDFSITYFQIENDGNTNIEYYFENGKIYFTYTHENKYYEKIAMIYKNEPNIYDFNTCEKMIISKYEERDISFLKRLLDDYCSILSMNEKYFLKKAIENGRIDEKRYARFINGIKKNIASMNKKQKYLYFRKSMRMFELTDKYRRKSTKDKVDLLHDNSEIEYPNEVEQLYNEENYDELYRDHSLEEIDLYIDLDKGRRK